MKRDEMIEKAAQQYKMDILRSNPMLDEVAISLNAVPTYEERKLVGYMWALFERLGAAPPAEDRTEGKTGP